MRTTASRRQIVGALMMLAIAPAAIKLALAAEDAVPLPPPAQDATTSDGYQTAVLAGGCFWGVQGVYQHTKGVIDAISGYAGGDAKTATYDQVSTGQTGHAEAVEIRFDPKQISYGKILQIFFSVVHDPTQLNRQGPDIGSQYRSEIFTTTDEQAKIANAYIAQLSAAKAFKAPIVTKLAPLTKFYRAEAYHQNYMAINPNQPYILFNDRPKVDNLKHLFAADYRDKPVLVRDTKMSN